MCGIIGAFDSREGASVNAWVVDAYEEQHARGQRGFGTVGSDGEATEVRRACTEAKFMFDLHARDWPMLLAHHRQPTSSDNHLDQTHPLAVRHDGLKADWLVVHNGVIRNCEKLKAEHEAMGFAYATAYVEVGYDGKETDKFNDSESLAIEVARYIEGQTDEVGTLGSAAFVALELEKGTGRILRVHYGRNSNPLHVESGKGFVRLSSEGAGADCEAFKLHSFEPRGDMGIEIRDLRFGKEEPEPATDWKPIPTASYVPTKQAAWTDDDDWAGYGPAAGGAAAGVGIQFREPALDDYLESMETECREFLDLLDDPETGRFADPEAFAKAMRSYAEEAIRNINEKYANEYALSDGGGDIGGTAGLGRPLPAAASGVEKGKL
jgi:hypothetical protein